MQSRSTFKLSMAAIPLAIVCGLLASSVVAKADSDDRPCSNRTLYGNYGFAITGEILAPGIPIRGLSMARYDGNGKFTQVDHIVTNGYPPSKAWTSGSGTYTVNPDCTGVAVINSPSNPEPVNVHFVITEHGKQINQVVDANAVTAIGNKVD
jgi:hypothetical protein